LPQPRRTMPPFHPVPFPYHLLRYTEGRTRDRKGFD
jgi:hypothetical protein